LGENRPVGREEVDGAAAGGDAETREEATRGLERARGEPLRHGEEVAVMLLGDHQEVAGVQRLDVEEGENLVVLVDHAHRLVAADDAAEDAVGLAAVRHTCLRVG
jgi:hypothetical protein